MSEGVGVRVLAEEDCSSGNLSGGVPGVLCRLHHRSSFGQLSPSD